MPEQMGPSDVLKSLGKGDVAQHALRLCNTHIEEFGKAKRALDDRYATDVNRLRSELADRLTYLIDQANDELANIDNPPLGEDEDEE